MSGGPTWVPAFKPWSDTINSDCEQLPLFPWTPLDLGWRKKPRVFLSLEKVWHRHSRGLAYVTGTEELRRWTDQRWAFRGELYLKYINPLSRVQSALWEDQNKKLLWASFHVYKLYPSGWPGIWYLRNTIANINQNPFDWARMSPGATKSHLY